MRQHKAAPTTTSLYEMPTLATSARLANSTRGFRSRPVKVPSVVRRRPGERRMPELSDMTAHLADAIAFNRVSQRPLNHLDVTYDEVCFLCNGFAALDAVYTEIDFPSIALSKPVRR